jgi:hypothetical protein
MVSCLMLSFFLCPHGDLWIQIWLYMLLWKIDLSYHDNQMLELVFVFKNSISSTLNFGFSGNINNEDGHHFY